MSEPVYTTDRCPTCGEPLVLEVERRPLREGPAASWTVQCAERHEFQVLAAFEFTHPPNTRRCRSFQLVVPEALPKPPPFPERLTEEPCVGCGREIQPGQAYVEGPRHLGC